jgi:hypothetical protein
MRRRPPVHEPPPELDADMTAGDIADELRRLNFDDNEFSAIKIDKPVRDYLVNTLTARHAARRA